MVEFFACRLRHDFWLTLSGDQGSRATAEISRFLEEGYECFAPLRGVSHSAYNESIEYRRDYKFTPRRQLRVNYSSDPDNPGIIPPELPSKWSLAIVRRGNVPAVSTFSWYEAFSFARQVQNTLRQIKNNLDYFRAADPIESSLPRIAEELACHEYLKAYALMAEHIREAMEYK